MPLSMGRSCWPADRSCASLPPPPCPAPLPLQNIAGPKPLLITELGLDSRAHGEEAQAAFFSQQLPAAFAAGAAGASRSQR